MLVGKRLVVALLLSLMLFSGAYAAQTSAPVKGTVIDSAGKPVEGIKVQVLLLRAGEGYCSEWSSEPLGEALTGSGGGYSVSPSKPYDLEEEGTAMLQVVHEPGKWMGFSYCYEPVLGENTVINISRPRTYEGTVKDITGKPLAGVTVEPVCLVGTANHAAHLPLEVLKPVIKFEAAVTDANGVYRIANIPEAYEVSSSAEKAGFAEVVTEYGVEITSNIVMGPGGSVSGRVVDANGKGLAGVPVEAYCTDGPAKGANGETAADGSFTLHGLSPVSYSITYGNCQNGFHMYSEKFTISTEKETRLDDLVMPTGVKVSGRVVDSVTGEPVKDAGVSASGESWHTASVDCDKDGNFSTIAVPGDVRVAYSGGNALYFAETSEPSEPVDVPDTGLSGLVVKVPKMEVASGTVVDGQGRPVEGAQVVLGKSYNAIKTVTGADGKFSVGVPTAQRGRAWDMPDGVTAQTVVLEASDREKKNAVFLNADRADLLKNGVTLKLKPTRTVRVVVKDMDGNPVPGASVSCVVWTGDTGYGEGGNTTNAEGVAELKGLIDGSRCDFDVSKKGLLEKSGPFEEEGRVTVGGAGWRDTLEFVLGPAPVVEGFVVGPDGSAAVGTSVEVSGWMGGTKAISDAAGRFRVTLSADLNDYSYSSNQTIGLRFISADRRSGLVQYVDTLNLEDGDVVFKMKPTRKLTVVAEDAGGKPLKDVRISLRADDRFSGSGRPMDVKTSEADGNACFEGICCGDSVSVAASCSGFYFRGKDLPRVGSGNWNDRVVIRLEPANRTQKGKVVDAQGKPVVGEEVSVWLSDDNQAKAITGPAGEFEISGLPESEVSVSARSDDYYGWAEASKDTPFITIELKQQDRF